MMTCLELELTAQLICMVDGTPVCTDNGSIAQLLGLPVCTSTEAIQPNDVRRRIQGRVYPAVRSGLTQLKPFVRRHS